MSTTKNEIFLYQGTQSLDVCYDFCSESSDSVEYENAEITLHAADIHAQLRAGVKGLLSTRSEMTFNNGRKTYTTDIDDRNFATVALTALYTDSTTDEGYLGEDVEHQTIHLTVPHKSERIWSVKDFYNQTGRGYQQAGVCANKAGRDLDFNQFLQQRVNSFDVLSSDDYYIPDSGCRTTNEIQTAISSPMFHENFHHSEQTAMHYLSSKDGVRNIGKWLARDCGAGYVYGIVADIYTQRMLCANCNISLLGMQLSTEGGFITDLSTRLKKKKVQPRLNGGMMFHARVSASRPQGKVRRIRDALDLNGVKNVVHEYNPDRDNWIPQANSVSLGTKRIINKENYGLDDFSGTFFVSKTFSKAKLEGKISSKPPIDDEQTEDALKI